MAVVILEPVSATLVAGAGRTRPWRRDQGAVLVMEVRLPHHAGIWLESDEKYFVGGVTLSIRAASREHLEAAASLGGEGLDSVAVDEVVGSLRYTEPRKATEDESARKASFEFEAFVPAKFMSNIVGLARKSRFPRKVWLDVRGLGYRTGARVRDARLSWAQPIDRPALPITDVSFEFPHHPHRDIFLIHSDRADVDRTHQEMTHALRRLEPLFIRISARMIWVVWFLVAVVVALVFLIWR